ncbi:MAG TPA: sigma 54-interacting transcriptional regulator [Thermoanaerobaculia bacterium]|nr:sigma 54-interacting transcriptional regulator [Thermoanaerobaculia bacterium]
MSFQLRGDVDGAERSFLLLPGINRVGSLDASNEVVLPARGVSRCHAEIVVDAETVTVHDLGSKNGTFVDGARVSEAEVAAGSVVRIGSVSLRLLADEREDAELAIELEDPSRPAGFGGAPTELDPSQAEGDGALPLLESVLERLTASDLRGALGWLAEAVGARGGWLLRWSDGEEPRLIVAVGEVALRRGFAELVSQPLADGACRVVRTEIEGGGLSAAVARSGGERLGLALWGMAGAAELPSGVARIFLRMVDAFLLARLPAEPTDAGLSGELPGLRLPEGYVPGESATMAALYREMRALAPSDIPVLLIGETGAGKEHLARILHASSPRREGPFVAVNCAAIPAELLEAEMFGIGKGVATGVSGRPGKFELARGGTLFLDEIGDMPLPLQAKLLRALQDREISPVGAPAVSIDIRVVSATNADVRRHVEEGRFRADLFYRLAGVALEVPPLRRRREDVPLLVESFIRTFSREAGKRVRGITVRALEALVDYPWPGNVRELEHEIRRLVHLCPPGQPIDEPQLSETIRHPTLVGDEPSLSPGEPLDLEAHVARLERRLILEALERTDGNRTQAARLLGISRNGLALKMERLGLDP